MILGISASDDRIDLHGVIEDFWAFEQCNSEFLLASVEAMHRLLLTSILAKP